MFSIKRKVITPTLVLGKTLSFNKVYALPHAFINESYFRPRSTIKNSCEVIEFEFHSSFIISAAGHNFSGATEVEFLDGV